MCLMVNVNFPLVQFPHHHVTAMLKTVMYGYSCMMIFLHLKVHNGQCNVVKGACMAKPGGGLV